MAVSPFIQRLRAKVGSELLQLPSTAVVPRNEAGEILLVRLSDSGNWATIGGAVEPGESPEQCAIREAEEEAGVVIQLGSPLGCFGGSEYRVQYPNGDLTSYVVTVFDATIISGDPRPDGDETVEVRWFPQDQLPVGQMGRLTSALVHDLGLAGPTQLPLLVVVTGLPGTGKSTVAESVGTLIRAPVLAHDWAMSGLRPFPEITQLLDTMEPPGHGPVGWSLLSAMARAELRRSRSVVLEGVAREPEIRALPNLAGEEDAGFLVVKTTCSDPDVHRMRIERRARSIPNWYELDWTDVQASMSSWDADLPADVTIDTLQPNEDGLALLKAAMTVRVGR